MASIQKRVSKSGEVTYRITVCGGYLANGKKVRRMITYKPPPGTAPTKADKLAEKEAFEFEQQLGAGYIADENPYFRDFAKYALELKLQNGLKQSTFDRYNSMMPEIVREIGFIRVKDLRPFHLNMFYKKLLAPGAHHTPDNATAKTDLMPIMKEKKLTKTGLAEKAHVSPSTVCLAINRRTIRRSSAESIAGAMGEKYSDIFRTIHVESQLSSKTVLEYHRLICAILSVAEKEMVVMYNAAKKASPPKQERPEVNYFQPDEILAILEALKTEPLRWQAITHLLMITGCRRGEVLGLKWEKIDFQRQRVKIDNTLLYSQEVGYYESTTKTGKSRIIPLPEETLDLLRKHKEAQEEMKQIMGDRWQDSDLVFTREDGAPMRPDSVTAWLRNFSEKHSLPHINPHAFRHTAASIMISHGTDVVTVSKMLGHSMVSTTEDIYSHLIEESKLTASNALADIYYRNNKEEK